MSQVQATMGITKDAMSKVDGQSVNTMDTLSALAKKMGAETAFSASQCADALNYLALAGYDTQQMVDTLPTVLNLAAAGSMDLASASDMVTDAMSALGMGVEQAEMMVDQMAKTASSTNTSVAQLGEGILTIVEVKDGWGRLKSGVGWIWLENPAYCTVNKTTSSTKTVDELAREVLNGAWGNGEDRKQRLTAAGYDYSAVQAKVNELVGATTPTKSIDELAREVTVPLLSMLNFSDEGVHFERRYCSTSAARGVQLGRYIHAQFNQLPSSPTLSRYSVELRCTLWVLYYFGRYLYRRGIGGRIRNISR